MGPGGGQMRMTHPGKPGRTRSGRLIERMKRCTAGVAMVEFAVTAPVFLLTGLGALELSHYALINLRISQAATHIADNASRVGESSNLSALRIYEADIQDLLIGVRLHAGDGTKLYEHGRVILSSLQQNSDGGQWIKWQRCMGKKNAQSAYGVEGDGAMGTGLSGMGPSGREIEAGSGEAVMYVEIEYDYQPLVPIALVAPFTSNSSIRSESAFIVRGNRDLSQVYTLPTPTTPWTCDKFQSV